MAANPRTEALEPLLPPSEPEAAESQILSVATDIDELRSDNAHPESPALPESTDSRYEAIARSAYFLAEARGSSLDTSSTIGLPLNGMPV